MPSLADLVSFMQFFAMVTAPWGILLLLGENIYPDFAEPGSKVIRHRAQHEQLSVGSSLLSTSSATLSRVSSLSAQLTSIPAVPVSPLEDLPGSPLGESNKFFVFGLVLAACMLVMLVALTVRTIAGLIASVAGTPDKNEVASISTLNDASSVQDMILGLIQSGNSILRDGLVSVARTALEKDLSEIKSKISSLDAAFRSTVEWKRSVLEPEQLTSLVKTLVSEAVKEADSRVKAAITRAIAEHKAEMAELIQGLASQDEVKQQLTSSEDLLAARLRTVDNRLSIEIGRLYSQVQEVMYDQESEAEATDDLPEASETKAEVVSSVTEAEQSSPTNGTEEQPKKKRTRGKRAGKQVKERKERNEQVYGDEPELLEYKQRVVEVGTARANREFGFE